MRLLKEGYKKTEVGVIPEEWDIKKLIDISEKIFVGIATSTTNYYTNEGTVLIRNQNIKSDKLDIQDLLKITDSFSEVNENKKLKYGDVLTVRTGYPGISCVVPKEFEGSQTFTTLITRPKKSHINPFYLSRYFNSELGKRIFNSGKAGGAQQNLGVKFLEDINVIIPPLKEQEKIAEILSTVDGQIDDTEMLIEKCQELKKGLMQRLLTRGIGHTEFKKTEVGEIPVEWEVKKLDVICEFLDGMRKPIKSSDRENMKGIIPYYGASGIIDWVNDYIFDEELILLGEDGENLKSRNVPLAFRVNGKCWVNNHAHVLRCKNANIDFVTEVLESKDYTSYVIGSAQPKLTQSQCKKILIQVPSLKEQERIAQILASIDNEIEGYKNRKQNLKKLKKGLMQQLLTGKIRTSI